jgi:hypothetical protein
MGTAPNIPRHGLRLLVWSVLVVVSVSLVAFGFWGISKLRRREAMMADAIATFGFQAIEREGRYPPWARGWIGADKIPNGWDTITGIRVKETDFADDDLANLVTQLLRFPDIRTLSLDDTNVSDGGLEQLKRLTHLEFITLTGTQVTDAGIAELRSALPGTRIID